MIKMNGNQTEILQTPIIESSIHTTISGQVYLYTITKYKDILYTDITRINQGKVSNNKQLYNLGGI